MKIRQLGLFVALFALAACSGGKDNHTPEGGGSGSSSVLPKPAGLTVTTTETTADVSWTAVSGADSYTYRLTLSGKLVKNATITQTSVTLDGLTAGTKYLFQVYASAGTEKSAYSDALEVVTQAKPGSDPASAPSYEDFKIPATEEELGALAFPGAEGGGMYTTGGRGGKVYHVTNLNDGGNGSLRYGIRDYKENGKLVRPLIIVFDVAGIIELQSDLKIETGDITIAGQTAPGDGICLKNFTTYIGADNVIIRFLRFRLGDEGNWSDEDIAKNKADGEDAIWGRYQKNIILDHCSMSWSIDETASFYANANFTMQWCIIAESMMSCRLHSKGDHGYGGIWGGKDASFHHNLLAHHQNRTPRFDHQHLYEENGVSTDTYRGNVDFRNCVNYNWGSSNGCYGGEGGHYNLVNNYYKKGTNSNDKKYFIEADGGYSITVNGVKTYFPYDWAYLHLDGNYNNEYPSGNSSYPDGVYWKKAYGSKEGEPEYTLSYEGHILTAPLSLKGKDGKDAYTTTHSAQKAMEQVCAWAGASLKRDAVDTRIAADVKNNTGKIIKDIADVKASYGTAWPAYNGTTIVDTDGDGIPDSVEDDWGLNKNSDADGAAIGFDVKKRYTNLEMYLHYLVKDVVAGGNADGTYTKL